MVWWPALISLDPVGLAQSTRAGLTDLEPSDPESLGEERRGLCPLRRPRPGVQVAADRAQRAQLRVGRP